MTEKKENVQRDKNIDPKEREKLESVRKAVSGNIILLQILP